MRRTNSAQSGSALIEFALVAPLLVTLLLGCFDLGSAMMARFKVSSATQTVVDLVSQSAVMSINDIANYVAAGNDALAPFSGSNIKFRITNIATNGFGTAYVFWSCGQGSMTPTAVDTIVTTTPTGTPVSSLLRLWPGLYGGTIATGYNTSFVMVEATYTFTPPAGLVIRSAQTFTSTAYALPRVSTFIGATNILGTTNPLGPSLSLLSMQQTSGNITCNTPLI